MHRRDRRQPGQPFGDPARHVQLLKMFEARAELFARLRGIALVQRDKPQVMQQARNIQPVAKILVQL